MIRTKHFYKYPCKELSVLIMDMYVYISERWFIIAVLHKMFGRATLPRNFIGERLKKNIFYSIAGRGRTQLISPERAPEKWGHF